MKTIYDDQSAFEFVTNFGFHRCFRDKKKHALILVCRTSTTGNTVSLNNDAQRSFLAFEPETAHHYHLSTPVRSEVFSAAELPEGLGAFSDYTVLNIDELIKARGNTKPRAKASSVA